MRTPNTWIQTFSGVQFYPMDPSPDDVRIIDIAHALSMKCRFNGHCSQFLSVAAHSVYVSYMCDPKDALVGLLHDAPEAYMPDVVSPVKPFLPDLSAMEQKLWLAICAKFGISPVIPESVHKADATILAVEAYWFMPNKPADWGIKFEDVTMDMVSTSPREAKMLFKNRFNELTQ